MRVFSRTNTISFNDYTEKIKKKHQCYESRLKLKKCNINNESPINIVQGKNSYLCNKQPSHEDNCKVVLYPYGFYLPNFKCDPYIPILLSTYTDGTNLQSNTYTDENGNTTTTYTDENGNTTTTYTDSRGNTTTTYTDANGNTTTTYTDSNGNTTTTYTDSRGNTTTTYTDSNGVNTTTYTGTNGNTTTTYTDANGNTI